MVALSNKELILGMIILLGFFPAGFGFLRGFTLRHGRGVNGNHAVTTTIAGGVVVVVVVAVTGSARKIVVVLAENISEIRFGIGFLPLLVEFFRAIITSTLNFSLVQ